MPDYAALARSVVLGFPHSVEDLIDTEVLLMAGNFFLASVKEHETEDQFEEPLPATQGIECFILWCYLPLYASIALPLSAPKLLRSKNSVDLALTQRQTHLLLQVSRIALAEILLPHRPELGGRTHRGVLGFVLRDGEEKLCVEEKTGDLVLLLVADMLANRLADRVLHVGPLALDDHQRNPVDEEHDVGSAGLLATTALDHELLGHVVGVVFRMFPVDIIKLKALGVSFDRLLQTLPHAQQVIRFLIGWQQAIIYYVLQCLNCREDIALAEGIRAASEEDGVLIAQLIRQYLVEEYAAQSITASFVRFFRAEVLVAEILQKRHRRKLGDELFLEGG